MRNRHRQTDSAVERLRLAIDCMPLATREAMLDGVRGDQRVIVGAYVDPQGGVCPMLAAHRRGARTDFLAFARSWDRFARARRGSRVATAREVRILVTQLEGSLNEASGQGLDQAISEHRALLSRTLRTRRTLPDGADPPSEIIARRLRRVARRTATEHSVLRPTDRQPAATTAVTAAG
jgi:hypothetical protein